MRRRIVGSRAVHLWDALCRAYEVLGFDRVLDGDEVLRDLVLARIIEPTSNAEALRVLAETGVNSTSYRTVKRRLPIIAKHGVHQAFLAACVEHLQERAECFVDGFARGPDQLGDLSLVRSWSARHQVLVQRAPTTRQARRASR